MKTYSAKPSEITQNWWLIDAQDLVLGRLASNVAMLLRGKHKPLYTPHLDCGDHVVVINADKVHLSGNKTDQNKGKVYYRHTGFPGGIKERTAFTELKGSHPERVFTMAVKRMISRNTLGRKQFSKLHVYAGSEHPHTAQQPKIFDFAQKNIKNKK